MQKMKTQWSNNINYNNRNNIKRLTAAYLFFNPILGGGYLYHVKSPESRHNVGVMGYQNSSLDICELTKKVTGPKKF